MYSRPHSRTSRKFPFWRQRVARLNFRKYAAHTLTKNESVQQHSIRNQNPMSQPFFLSLTSICLTGWERRAYFPPSYLPAWGMRCSCCQQRYCAQVRQHAIKGCFLITMRISARLWQTWKMNTTITLWIQCQKLKPKQRGISAPANKCDQILMMSFQRQESRLF